jgi:hypothetical protein
MCKKGFKFKYKRFLKRIKNKNYLRLFFFHRYKTTLRPGKTKK